MVIGLTGHRSGIGKALFDKLSTAHRVLGFSKSDGYDISDLDHQKKIIEQISSECDVFINNAYSTENRTAQLFLLKEIYKKWKSSPKLIIVNTSLLPTFKKWNEIDGNLTAYVESKQLLIDECERLMFEKDRLCRVVNMKLGFVNTPLTEKFNIEKLDTAAVIPYFEQVLKDPFIHEMTIKL